MHYRDMSCHPQRFWKHCAQRQHNCVLCDESGQVYKYALHCRVVSDIDCFAAVMLSQGACTQTQACVRVGTRHQDHTCFAAAGKGFI